MTNKINIVFMRHGRSLGDDEEVHEGRYDAPLTDVGRAQAEARARGWAEKKERFDTIIASPLRRAHETAQIVAKILQVPLEIEPDWMEMDNGPLAGLSYEEAERRFPKPAFRNPYEPFFETGESNWEIYCRAARAVEKVVRRGPGDYLVVAHGGILNAALRSIVGAPPDVNRQGIWFALADTGYVRTVYVPDQHQWVIRQLTG